MNLLPRRRIMFGKFPGFYHSREGGNPYFSQWNSGLEIAGILRSSPFALLLSTFDFFGKGIDFSFP
jgi:hypothetical protein